MHHGIDSNNHAVLHETSKKHVHQAPPGSCSSRLEVSPTRITRFAEHPEIPGTNKYVLPHPGDASVGARNRNPKVFGVRVTVAKMLLACTNRGVYDRGGSAPFKYFGSDTRIRVSVVWEALQNLEVATSIYF